MLRFLFNLLQVLTITAWSSLVITLSLTQSLLLRDRARPLVWARKVWAPWVLRLLGARLRVEPLPALDWSRPYIFVMNHQSMADVPVAFTVLPLNLRFVATLGLKYVPFLGWYMWWTEMVFVNRSDRSQALASLAEAGRHIREGASILAFPEGTRSRDGRVAPFKKGPFVLALEAGVPIVPMAIEGAGKVFAPDGLLIRGGEIRLKVGTPIATAGRPAAARAELLMEVRDAIVRMNEELGGLGGQAVAIAAPGPAGRAAAEAGADAGAEGGAAALGDPRP